MTDSQFGILIAAIVTVAASLGAGFRALFRWAVKQIVDVLRDNEIALKDSTKALLRHEVRAEELHKRLGETMETIESIGDWMEDNTPVESSPSIGRYRKHKKRKQTNPSIVVNDDLKESSDK